MACVFHSDVLSIFTTLGYTPACAVQSVFPAAKANMAGYLVSVISSMMFIVVGSVLCL